MEKEELSRGQYRVYLDRYEYRTLLNNAPDPTTALAIRLGGEVGLKVSEIVNVQLQHAERSDVAPDKYFLFIPTEEDEDDQYARGRPRRAYLPRSVHEFMQEYAEANDVSHNEDLIQYAMRSIQNFVKDAAKAAAEETGKEDFELVSSLDLRIFFARQAISRWRIHPRVLLEIGGWNDMQSLREQLEEPTETKIIREFERVEFQGLDEWMTDVGPRPMQDRD
ncbi:hypothetical protein [Natronoarchaeum rubrum]|uniref:hypothetical protein n=1 Tax=Natronoarchaeum rubrum TaxID=755311 RepID=UPI0021131EED|nr:hypothetical protein [Natronoarchaeum rubrum]